MRTCHKCKILKEDTEFHKAAAKCKECTHDYYMENRERIIAKQTEWNAAHADQIRIYQTQPKYRERRRKTQAAWRARVRLKNGNDAG